MKHQVWKIGIVGIVFICICTLCAINVFAIDTPWIDIPQDTEQETAAAESTGATQETHTDTTQQTTDEMVESNTTAIETPPTNILPSLENELDKGQVNEDDSILNAGCASSLSVQMGGGICLLYMIIVGVCLIKKTVVE